LDEGGSPPPDLDAPPLPFVGTSNPTTKPASPQRATKRRIRPELVDEQAEEKEKEALESVKRKREVRRILRKMDEEEAAEEERYEDIDEQCGWGRLALNWLRWGMGGYATSVLLVFFAMLGFVVFTMMGTPLGTVMAPMAFLGLALGALSTVVLMIGFGIALRGPTLPRHIAVFGLIASASQIITVAATIGTAIGQIQKAEESFRVDDGWGGTDLPYYILGLCSNLFLLADAPTRLILNYPFPRIAILAAILEFARLVFVCQMVQTYAELGKNDRPAADAGKGISRVFWVVLLTCMFRFAIAMGFDWFPHQDAMWLIGQALHGLLFIVAFGFFGFRLLMIVQAAQDTVDTLIADRVASRAAKLDVV
jgi:hypothetical protein